MLGRNRPLSYLLCLLVTLLYGGVLVFIIFSFTSQNSPFGFGSLNPFGASLNFDSVSQSRSYSGKLLTTNNGGQDWQVATNLTGSVYYRLSCPALDTCFAIGQGLNPGTLRPGPGSLVYVTHDSGKHWLSSSLTTTAKTTLHAVDCPSLAECYVVGYDGEGNKLFSSQDGGVSWTKKISSGVFNNGEINSLSCPVVQVCFVSGEEGLIASTTDGGTSWTAHQVETDFSLNHIVCPDASHCVAVGEQGVVVATANGGTSWTVKKSATSGDLAEVACPSPQLCFALSSEREPVTKITLAGPGENLTLSFASLKKSGNHAFYGISCPTTATCFIAGTGGLVQVTRDGGQTWSEQPSGLTSQLSELKCPSKDTCYLLTGYY